MSVLELHWRRLEQMLYRVDMIVDGKVWVERCLEPNSLVREYLSLGYEWVALHNGREVELHREEPSGSDTTVYISMFPEEGEE